MSTTLLQKLGATGTSINKAQLWSTLDRAGLRRSSPMVSPASKFVQELPDPLSEADLQSLKQHSLIVSRAIDQELVFPDWGNFADTLSQVYDVIEPERGGHVATYIPQLARVNPEQFGVSACSIDGQQWGRGDNDVFFCLQSVSKAITYACILEEHGTDKVHKHIGREPSGVGFNERVLNADGLPHNPCINSGAIMACSLVKPSLPTADRFDYMMDIWSRICGGRKPGFGNATYLSERATADRNFCLAYMMQEEKAFPEGTDLVTTLELYFMMCSIEVTCDMLSIAAATFASGGVCPLTGDRVFSEQTVRNTLSLVASCGMYDASGQFIFDIGFPAKSGVGGGLMIVIPGKCGLATFSPRLEGHGNSLRGVRFCEQLATRLNFHQFSIDKYAFERARSHQQLNNELLFAVKRNELQYVRACVARGADVNYADYDKRTALHVAASEGFAQLVSYLLAHGADRALTDRYGATPLDDAKREKRDEVAALFAAPPALKVQYTASAQLPAGDESRATRAARYFAALDDNGNGTVRAQVLANTLRNSGYDSENSKLLKPLFQQLRDGDRALDLPTFSLLVDAHPEVGRAVTNHLALADFKQFESMLTSQFDAVRQDKSGALPTYIPTLAKANPDHWAVAACSVSGQQILLGDYEESWCVQSTCKVINYLIALDQLGEEAVHKHVSKEPSGRNFNQMCLDKHNLPHNPVINAGAIMVCSLIKPKESQSDRFAFIKAQWKRLTGGTDIGFDNETFLAEAATATRNWTLAYMMLDANAFPAHIKTNQDLKETLELYFMTCSLTITAQQMAIVGATLANGGVNPLSGERVFKQSDVRNCLSIMNSCGLYDYSGEFQFKVGMPAKSGVAGGIVALQPSVFGICTWSPLLGKLGNSVRGVALLEEIAKQYNVHVYDSLTRDKRDLTLHGGSSNEDRISDLLFAAGSGDVASVRKTLAHGTNPNSVDYDLRSSLHVAAAEGHVAACKLLLAAGADPTLRDRWNSTPKDEATRNGHEEIVRLFSSIGN